MGSGGHWLREGKDAVKSKPTKLTVRRTRVKWGGEPRARAYRNLGKSHREWGQLECRGRWRKEGKDRAVWGSSMECLRRVTGTQIRH